MSEGDGGRAYGAPRGALDERSLHGDRGTAPLAGKRTLAEQAQSGIPPVQRKFDGEDDGGQGDAPPGQVTVGEGREASASGPIAASISILELFGRSQSAQASEPARAGRSAKATAPAGLRRTPRDVAGNPTRDGGAVSDVGDRGVTGAGEPAASVSGTDPSRISALDIVGRRPQSTPIDAPPVQRKLAIDADAGQRGGAGIAGVASRGIASTGSQLPHLDQIQASFGHHDVSGVQAHQGTAAAAATHELGAKAYAFGNAVAFGESPDLHTAAHEAAHVVQQRGGVQLKGGIDEPGDEHERHADAVADRVVAGQSAESMLDQVAGGGGEAAADPTAQGRLIGHESPGAEADAGPAAGSAVARPRGGTNVAARGTVSSSGNVALQRSPANTKSSGQQEVGALRKELGLSITTSPEVGGSNTAYVGGQVRFGLAFANPPKMRKVQATSWSLEIPGGGRFSQVPTGPATTLPINHVGRHRFVVVIEVDDTTTFEIEHQFDAIQPSTKADALVGDQRGVSLSQFESQLALQKAVLSPPGAADQAKGAALHITTAAENPARQQDRDPTQLHYAVEDREAVDGEYHWYAKPFR